MTWEIVFGGDPEDILVTTHGTATVEGLHAYAEETIAHPSFRPGARVILDETDLDWSAMSTSDLRRRTELVPGYLDRIGDVRLAIVSPHTVDVGIHRQMDAYAGGFPFEWTIVRTLDEARAWLRATPSPPA